MRLLPAIILSIAIILAPIIWIFLPKLMQGSQDEFAGGPASITLEHLLQGDGFVAVLLVSVGLREYLVEGVEQVSADGAHALPSALTELDEVIDEDIVAS